MVLCIVGALLILVQSVDLVLVGRFFQSPTWGVLGVSITVLGGFGILLAILLEIFAMALYFAPNRHLTLGVGMMTFSLLSLYSGGGVILGFLLCYVAGLIAIFATPPSVVRGGTPVVAPEAADDPVIEADLLDSGLAPQSTVSPDARTR
jgi:hypothetical protein